MGQHVIVPLSFIGMLNNQRPPFIVFRENKIEGTPILKLAMVKR
jgi:hypothetical protein